MDNTRIVRAYLNLRDARTALKREFEEKDTELKAKQQKLENLLLKFLSENNMDSVKTPVGTFYRQEEVTPTGADWHAIYEWVKQEDAFDILERRLKKTFVKEYMETHNGGMPPGVSVYREYVVRVRRGS